MMEENVALDSKKQKKFDKSIKGIKQLLKKNEAKPHKPAVLAPKDDDSKDDKKKRKHKERGLVYLSHIPHGFYEHEMTQYFKQFGMVTKVRVIRSPRTGRSKGFAFVEFREPAVAEIVAETMNNYLMGKRLIKAAIIPPEKQKHKAFRKHWSTKNNPTTNRRVKERKAYNAPKTDAEHLIKAKKMLSNLNKNKKKLSDLGIDYDFFTPVDVPEELSQKTQAKVESESKKVKVKSESEAKKINNEPEAKQNKNKKIKAKETQEKLTKDKKPEIKSKPDTKNKTEVKKVQETDKVKQNEKQKKMHNAGVKLPENFIKVGEESGEESDSSLDFDSDEYEKMLKNDSDVSSGEDSEDDDGEDGSDGGEEESDDGDESGDSEKESGDGEESGDSEEESGEEDSEEELPPLIPIKEKKSKKPVVAALPPQPQKAKPVQKQQPAQKQQHAKKQQLAQKQQPVQKNGPKPNAPKVQQQPQVLKRKNPQSEVSPKKPKFEKQDKPRNKQFKKKNKA